MKSFFNLYKTVYCSALWIIIFLCCSSFAFAQRAIPEHAGVWVHDEAKVLSENAVQQLEHLLKRHRDSTSNQIAVYIIPTLAGEDIDDYSVQVFQKWKLGQKGKDNGVLFLVAIEDRKVRIEVGYGLEGVLTDLQSSRINRNEVAPRFRGGNYQGGVIAGVIAIMQTIEGEYVNDNPQANKKRKGRSPLFTVLLILGVIIFLSRRNGGRGGRGGGYWSSGGGWMGPMIGGGFGSSSGSWGSGGDFGGGGFSGGGGSSDSW